MSEEKCQMYVIVHDRVVGRALAINYPCLVAFNEIRATKKCTPTPFIFQSAISLALDHFYFLVYAKIYPHECLLGSKVYSSYNFWTL